ncbi:hypothetical protein F4825DRAFT_408668 [Nemania diffusa]|nr:hypothetical protein F4825DRAFT_408668 [Nemania diffusa]
MTSLTRQVISSHTLFLLPSALCQPTREAFSLQMYLAMEKIVAPQPPIELVILSQAVIRQIPYLSFNVAMLQRNRMYRLREIIDVPSRVGYLLPISSPRCNDSWE